MGQSATPIWNVQNPVRTFGPDGAARPGTVNSGPAVLDAVRLFRLRMDQPDLSKLRIDRSVAPVRRRRTRRWIILGVVALAVFGGAAWYAMQPRVAAVQTTAVVTTWPSQQFVVLNATGDLAPFANKSVIPAQQQDFGFSFGVAKKNNGHAKATDWDFSHESRSSL